MTSPVRVTRGLLAEVSASAGVASRWIHGFGPALERHDVLRHPDGTAAPVVLVHGLCANKSYWVPLEQHLLALGHPVLALNYSWANATIASCGTHVAEEVDRLLDRLGTDQVRLVGHSLGGVVLKWAMHNTGLAEVTDHVVSLGSPHQGSPWAELPAVGSIPVLGTLIRELHSGSEALHEQALALPTHVRWTTVGGGMDALVPAGRAALRRPSGPHHVFDNLGHIAMVSDRRVISLVERAVTSLSDLQAAS